MLRDYPTPSKPASGGLAKGAIHDQQIQAARRVRAWASPMIAAGPSLAKPVKHTRHTAARHAGVRGNANNAEIEALKAQVEALTGPPRRAGAELRAGDRRRSTTRPMQAAAAQATALAGPDHRPLPRRRRYRPRSRPSWHRCPSRRAASAGPNDTSISGRMYFNFSNVNQKVERRSDHRRHCRERHRLRHQALLSRASITPVQPDLLGEPDDGRVERRGFHIQLQLQHQLGADACQFDRARRQAASTSRRPTSRPS